MVERLPYTPLYLGEVNHHAVLVQLLGAAAYRDTPVVAVWSAALAVVRQLEVVAGRNLYCLLYIVHVLYVFSGYGPQRYIIFQKYRQYFRKIFLFFVLLRPTNRHLGKRTVCCGVSPPIIQNSLEKKLDMLSCDHFSFIHGDCTFSNMMVRDKGDPVLIDPRGYFGYTELYGDVRYDWAKLYYSVVGNYDRFNLKKFHLEIGGDNGSVGTELPYGEVRLDIESNGWEDMEQKFFELTKADPYEIKLLHAVIWLSLTTYAWQDYDSVCGAFYNGLYYLEDVL